MHCPTSSALSCWPRSSRYEPGPAIVIGEASRNIERVHPGYAAAHPELPLALASDMRNALAHGYFKVDLPIVWKTVQQDLPQLSATVRMRLAELKA